MVVGEHTYPRTKTATTKDCTAAAQGTLGSLLSHNGCKQLLRATYSKGGVAVTVGIAVFDSPAKAASVKNEKQGRNLIPLPGGGVPSAFCQGTKCRMTTNCHRPLRLLHDRRLHQRQGRHRPETKARQIGRDGGWYAFNQITQRGKDQAAQAAEKQLDEARSQGRGPVLTPGDPEPPRRAPPPQAAPPVALSSSRAPGSVRLFRASWLRAISSSSAG